MPSKPPKKPAKKSTAFTATDGHSAYEHFLPVVDAFDAADVDVARGKEISVAKHNVGVGVDAMASRLDTLEGVLPKDVTLAELKELPSLVLALVYADSRVTSRAPSGIDERLAKVRKKRELTLKQLEIFADLGLAPTERVAAIRAGSGKLDTANDCVAIAGLFKELGASIAGKHPFDDAYLEALGTDGAWLVARIKPAGTKDPYERAPEALVCDRFWKEIERRYGALRLLAAHVFGLDGLDARVPPLMSRTHARKKDAPAASPPTTSPTPSAPVTPGK